MTRLMGEGKNTCGHTSLSSGVSCRGQGMVGWTVIHFGARTTGFGVSRFLLSFS